VLTVAAGVGLGLVLGALLRPPPAAAHADLVGTAPANGERLAVAPAQILLPFTEPVVPAPDGVTLVDASGARRDREPARVVAGSPHDIVLAVPAGLSDGVYTVSWRVVSADSHPLHGAFVFGVGPVEVVALTGGGARTDGDPAVAVAFWLVRGLGYVGLAVLAGGLLFLYACWPGGWSRPRTRRVLLAAWCVSVVGAVGALLLQGPYGVGGPLAQVADLGQLRATLDTDYGLYVVVRLGVLLVGGVLVHSRTRPNPPRVVEPAVVALLGVALPATWTGTGHARAYGGPLPALADTVHLVAMSAWVGGLVLLATCLLPRSAAQPVRDVASALTRFSRVATMAVVALVVTGAYQAWRGLGSWAALPGSRYGTLLVFKLALIGLLLWFGALSRSAVRRRYLTPVGPDDAGSSRSRRRAARADRAEELRARAMLHRFVRVEAAILVVVLGVTSVLVATPPGQRSESAPIRLAQAPAFTTELTLDGGGRVQVEVNPARVGPSRLAVRVRDPGGAPWDVPEVSGALALPAQRLGPLRIALDRLGPGSYASGALTLPVAGTWELRVSVRTSEIDSATVLTQLAVS
jgi:copper transport protein